MSIYSTVLPYCKGWYNGTMALLKKVEPLGQDVVLKEESRGCCQPAWSGDEGINSNAGQK